MKQEGTGQEVIWEARFKVDRVRERKELSW